MTQPYRFHTALIVRFNETDAQGHVNFAEYLNYFDVGLIAYMKEISYSYTDLIQADLDMLYIDSHATYHAPSRFDECLQIHCRIGKIGNSSVRFDFQVFSEDKDCLVSTGEITAVLVQKNSWSKVSVPEPLRRAVEEYETGQEKLHTEAE